jgi:hypothetical protein
VRFPESEAFRGPRLGRLSNAEANSPIAIGYWPGTAISAAVVLVQPEEGLFVMFKSASTSLILLWVLATSYIRAERR